MVAAITWSDVWQVVGIAAVLSAVFFAGWFAYKLIDNWERPRRADSRSKSALDRNLVYMQWWIGAGLVVFGATILIGYHYATLFPDAGDKATQTVTYVATAIIGAGIAALPTTAGGAASARISAAAAAVAASAPIVETGSATRNGAGDVVFHGTVDPKGADTTYFFQYRSASEVDYTRATEFKKILASLTGQAAPATSEPVVDVDNGWHYRIVAYHEGGALISGEDKEVSGL